MPFKFHALRRHHIPRAKYRVMNWPDYDRGWGMGDHTIAAPCTKATAHRNRTNARLDLALRQMPVAYDPTAAGRVRQMRIRLDKTGNFWIESATMRDEGR